MEAEHPNRDAGDIETDYRELLPVETGMDRPVETQHNMETEAADGLDDEAVVDNQHTVEAEIAGGPEQAFKMVRSVAWYNFFYSFLYSYVVWPLLLFLNLLADTCRDGCWWCSVRMCHLSNWIL